MKEEVLDIASKYFHYHLTRYTDEYVSTEIPGWVFMRVYDDKCYIINALYYASGRRPCMRSSRPTV